MNKKLLVIIIRDFVGCSEGSVCEEHIKRYVKKLKKQDTISNISKEFAKKIATVKDVIGDLCIFDYYSPADFKQAIINCINECFGVEDNAKK